MSLSISISDEMDLRNAVLNNMCCIKMVSRNSSCNAMCLVQYCSVDINHQQGELLDLTVVLNMMGL